MNELEKKTLLVLLLLIQHGHLVNIIYIYIYIYIYIFPTNIINRNIKEYLDKKLQKEEIGKKRAENTIIEYFK